MDDGDPHDEIVRLEAQIDTLADKIESCRKFILASRIAIAGGAVVFAAMVAGVVALDIVVMSGAVAAMIGGIAVWGSNRSTAQEAVAELAAIEAQRSVLIGSIELRLVPESPTLH